MTTTNPSASLVQTATRNLKRAIDRYVLPDSMLFRKQYINRHGFAPDLVEPKDLSEKLLWLKMYDRSALHTQCADKIRARDYVAAKLGPETIIPALRITYDPADIEPTKIDADRFVVKTNHDQGGVFLCSDRSTFNWAEVRKEVAARLAVNKYYEFREHQYKDIRPGILVEDFIDSDDGNVREIKFYCFHGVPGFIQVVYDRFVNRREIFYDPDWKRMPFSGPGAQLEHEIDPPHNLAQLMEWASILSEPFLCCRIDFLLGRGDRPWFGEITFHHGAGLIRFQPKEFERKFGDMIDLSRLEETRRRREGPVPTPARFLSGRAAPSAG
ncbi:ATP-grasp fold amidoligase family protein [Amaricoccus sp.]|uniref:ATP-grasp fold amidoligase family protein n=1 Tax=Amaricoccus sp. TaxID=1872485 RepID=UPI001B54C4D1|nr:ATP-grasp fold amidoligase family protein [Amaricoccus sp.]MBP7241061.1 hypothetical protein [Amaricoccus sp.]